MRKSTKLTLLFSYIADVGKAVMFSLIFFSTLMHSLNHVILMQHVRHQFERYELHDCVPRATTGEAFTMATPPEKPAHFLGLMRRVAPARMRKEKVVIGSVQSSIMCSEIFSEGGPEVIGI